ncbi:DUF1600 domain-containing protein [Mycoplasmoides pneumoniae]|uniref:DUF1600 domain-containing protein n=1 Tax=Mycoplasmoides pneumoniae TaxID=2104 RepID=UPI00056FCBBB|nr:DUF1600 domain-containing protein [Mycoplasmoides pneumoniae]ALX06956.1 hypothetical protein AVK85_03690 [Mycoplasmoides pneumoniae]AMF84799.1 hypothetical protein AXA72_03800 [Mycoplasmoides pneumoniae]QHR04900.1 DUF1600 domain-containing protein [Mycoplasmoides pneumoniae]QHR07011.1 DUF1600 domain-containing protein [Mycoplasmoides pneumoniae]QHR11206.1 DUF1600 domain-containing protein [Mycoplasmoides pneumoniae]
MEQNNCKIRTWFAKLALAQKVFLGVIPLFFICFVFVIADIVISLQNKGHIIEEIDKFTNQSNVMLLIYACWYVSKPKSHYLKNQQFFLSAFAYIIFTFLGYNVILAASQQAYSDKDAYSLASSVFLHVLAPIAFLVAGIVKMKTDKDVTFNHFWKSLGYFMIYSLVYGLYLATIPYVRGHYVSDDGKSTTYVVYGEITNTKDNPIVAWPVVICFLFIYFPLSFLAVYALQCKLLNRPLKAQFKCATNKCPK